MKVQWKTKQEMFDYGHMITQYPFWWQMDESQPHLVRFGNDKIRWIGCVTMDWFVPTINNGKFKAVAYHRNGDHEKDIDLGLFDREDEARHAVEQYFIG